MAFQLKSGKKKVSSKDIVIVFTDENKKDINTAGIIVESSALDFFTAKQGEIYHFHEKGNSSVIFCGLGDIKKINSDKIRTAASAVTEYCNSKKIKDIIVSIPEIKEMDEETVALNIAEGLILSNYAFNIYKSEVEQTLLERVFVLSESKKLKASFERLSIMAENIYLCRDLVNGNADEINPPNFAERAKRIASKKGSGLKAAVLDKKGIIKNRLGLIEAVNRSSSVEPRVVILEYRGDTKKKSTIGLIGKGVTYDSGGLNLKSGTGMLTMKCDMAGAATILATMKSIAELKIKANVTAVIPLSENMIGADSYKPGDVYTSHSGKTVEIGNTDAEGRLLLADAISYMKEKYKPEIIVDTATLTGACVATFGETVAAFLSNSDKISEKFEKSSQATGEKVWRLPLFSDYDDRMKSEIADLSNMSSEKNAGTITSAVFLRHFVGETDWLHLDIAGTAYYSQKRGYLPKNATGFGIRTLVNFIENN